MESNRVYYNFCKKILTLNGVDVAGICTGADFEIRAGKTPKITLYLASDVILDVEGDVYGTKAETDASNLTSDAAVSI